MMDIALQQNRAEQWMPGRLSEIGKNITGSRPAAGLQEQFIHSFNNLRFEITFRLAWLLRRWIFACFHKNKITH
jgi:hypothetical protein